MVTKRTKKKSVKKNAESTGKNTAVKDSQSADSQTKAATKTPAPASKKTKTSSSKQKQAKKSASQGASKKTSSSKAQTNAKKSQTTKEKKAKKSIWPKVVIAVFVVILAVIALVVWWRWFMFDDANDFKDQWIDLNQSVELSITEEQMELTPDVKYTYEVDTFSKKVTYSFANLSGEASYRFSPDRMKLYIIEGEDSGLFTDLGLFLGLIEEPDYASQSNMIVLMRVSAYEEAERLKQEEELAAQLEQQNQVQDKNEADKRDTSDGDSKGNDTSGEGSGSADEPGKTGDPETGNDGQNSDDQGSDSDSNGSNSEGSGSGGSGNDPFGGMLQDRTGPT